MDLPVGNAGHIDVDADATLGHQHGFQSALSGLLVLRWANSNAGNGKAIWAGRDGAGGFGNSTNPTRKERSTR